MFDNMDAKPCSSGLLLPVVVALFLMPAVATPSLSQTDYLPSGFVFGSTLKEAAVNAEDNGWTLQKIQPLENSWSVVGTKLNLIFCNDLLATMEESTDAGFEDFIDTVVRLRLAHGEPQTEFARFPLFPHERRQISMRFQANDQLAISVNLYSYDGEVRQFRTYSNPSICQLPETIQGD